MAGCRDLSMVAPFDGGEGIVRALDNQNANRQL